MARLVGAREIARITSDSMRKLHDALDAKWNVKCAASKRKNERLPYHAMNVQLVVRNPVGESETHCLQCRDLSKFGLGAISVTFIYPGSSCSVMLLRNDGEREMILGSVINCIHVHKRLHRIGVKFTDPIDLADFLDLDHAVRKHLQS